MFVSNNFEAYVYFVLMKFQVACHMTKSYQHIMLQMLTRYHICTKRSRGYDRRIILTNYKEKKKKKELN